MKEATETLEKKMIQEVLEHNNWHREKAALSLGIPRMSLYRKLKKYNIDPE
ncbi:MAG: hypothetical protein GY751_02020 [Bacteroidetes bacterium]|nr:hypothetical protein [Bacteroidota bacterium]